jgi:hypothetical protein
LKLLTWSRKRVKKKVKKKGHRELFLELFLRKKRTLPNPALQQTGGHAVGFETRRPPGPRPLNSTFGGGGNAMTFVADTDPELRSLLSACQVADDPLPALAKLAGWLEERGDPRGPVVRIQTRYWYVYYCDEGYKKYYAAEAEELQRRSDEECEPAYERWLGFRGNGDTIAIACQMPLLDLQVADLEPVRQHLPKLRAVLQAGWVWSLYVLGAAVDDILGELLPGTGPIRDVGFGEAAAAALRDGDLATLQQVPHLRALTLSGSRVSDAGLRHLHRVRGLRVVELARTRVSRAGVAALREALPACEVLGV